MVFEQGSDPRVWENCGHPGPEELSDLSRGKLVEPSGFSFQRNGCHPRKEATRAQHPTGLGLAGVASTSSEKD